MVESLNNCMDAKLIPEFKEAYLSLLEDAAEMVSWTPAGTTGCRYTCNALRRANYSRVTTTGDRLHLDLRRLSQACGVNLQGRREYDELERYDGALVGYTPTQESQDARVLLLCFMMALIEDEL